MKGCQEATQSLIAWAGLLLSPKPHLALSQPIQAAEAAFPYSCEYQTLFSLFDIFIINITYFKISQLLPGQGVFRL